MKKCLYKAALIFVLVILGSTIARAVPAIDSPITDRDAPITVISDDDNSYVMTGANGAVLLVDSISTQEYVELMEVLYPNGMIDGQGQDIPGIDNIPEARAQFIAEHMKAYALNGTVKAEVDLIPFEITVTDKSNGTYEGLLYKAAIGNDTFVFPSEWGNQSFGFTSLSEKNIYIAFTDMGIWQIDPDSMSAEILTADTYLGKNQTAISAEFEDIFPEWYLTWIDSVFISPDGSNIVYRTNRDSTAQGETSLWKIDLSTGKETQFVSPAIHNDVVGFITDSDIVVGSLSETRVASLIDGTTVLVDVPELPNLRVSSTKNGIIVFSSYEDGSSDTTAYINRVDLSTGKVSPIAEVVGYLDGEPSFSPSGSMIAIGYGTDPMNGTDDVMIVDLATKTQSLLTQSMISMQSAQITNKDIAHFLWIDDNTILVDEQSEITVHPVEMLSDETATYASAYDIIFGGNPPSVVNFNSPLSCSSTCGFASVNSKWNQPRNVGTNPHEGVDVQASLNTNVYAPCSGWATGITGAGPYDIQFLVDANNNKVQDDGDYYIRFYHLNSREADGYKEKGALIGKSGSQGTLSPHLHFGVCSISGGLKWLRNEINYRHLSSTNWNSGKDLDVYAVVSWDYNIASFTAYIRNDGAKEPFGEVRIYYRTTTSGAWTDGGVLTNNGDFYSFDFSKVVPSGTTVQWMVRLTRTGVTQAAFCPAKFYQPSNNPNSVAYAYGYWTNTVSY